MSWWWEHEASELIDKFSTSTFHTSASLWWDHTFVSSSIYRWQLALQYPSSWNHYLSVKPAMMRPIRFLAKAIFSPVVVGGLSGVVMADSSGSLLLGAITWMGEMNTCWMFVHRTKSSTNNVKPTLKRIFQQTFSFLCFELYLEYQ